jgi:hypothetical protein
MFVDRQESEYKFHRVDKQISKVTKLAQRGHIFLKCYITARKWDSCVHSLFR